MTAPSTLLPYSLLETCPEDVWRLLSTLLNSEDLISLWWACNRRLLARFCPSVQEFRHEGYKPLLFRALSMFKLRILTLSMPPQTLKPNLLLSLPATLRELSLNYTYAQSCWLRPVSGDLVSHEDVNARYRPILLNSLFPELFVLSLTGQDAWDIFPVEEADGSTTPLFVTWTNAWCAEWLENLPETLNTLILPNLLIHHANLFSHMPYLTKIQVANTFPTENPTWNLPPNLETLILPHKAKLTAFNAVPSLDTLSISTGGRIDDLAPHIPSTLHSLTFRVGTVSNGSFFSNLPSNLTRLHLFDQCFHSQMAPYLPRSLTELIVHTKSHWAWEGLPEGLKFLHLGPSESSTERSIHRYKESNLEALPRGLETLTINVAMPVLRRAVTNLPTANLTRLSLLCNNEIADHSVLSLPRTLRFLRIDRVEFHVGSMLERFCPKDTALHFPGSFRSILKCGLPNGIELIINEWTIRLNDEDALKLPHNLESLIISKTISSLTPQFINNLPKHLLSFEYLNQNNGTPFAVDTFEKLPKTLTNLRIERLTLPPLKELKGSSSLTLLEIVAETNDGHQHRSTLRGWVNTLPPNLLHLRLGASVPLHYKFALALPQHLETLILPQAHGGRSKDFAALPRTLRTLIMPKAGNRLTDEGIPCLPPLLNYLEMDGEYLTEKGIFSFPPTLTYVNLRNSLIPRENILPIVRGEIMESRRNSLADMEAAGHPKASSARRDRLGGWLKLKKR